MANTHRAGIINGLKEEVTRKIAILTTVVIKTGPVKLAITNTFLSVGLYFILLRHPIWGTNDDVGMSITASGFAAASGL